MDSFSMMNTDPRELTRRRQLANARQERESERRALLVKLVRTEQRAGQLRDWIEAHEVSDVAEPNPELTRMLDWARAQLDAMNLAVAPTRVSEWLRDRNLFPEVDELGDPLGDPPPRQPWGR